MKEWIQASMEIRQSLQTILFTDIVGSTERASELGDRGWSELLKEHHARVRSEIRRFGGREVKVIGDGFLAVFPRPAQAIRCAWAVHETVRGLGLEVRSGIHTGEVEHQGRDLGGIAVHIGSRIAAHAGAGDILVSNAVREMETGAGFRFGDRGKHELKGVPGEWQLYALKGLPTGSASRSPRRTPASFMRRMKVPGAAVLAVLAVLAVVYVGTRGPGQQLGEEVGATTDVAAPAVAVLPFSMRGQELAVLHEGMVDLLSTGLDGAAGLRTISAGTVFARWREDVPGDETPELGTALEVARRTGARYALVGSGLAVGANARLVADVYDLETGERIGQGQAEGPLGDMLQLVDRLGVDVLRIILQRGEEGLPEIDLASLTTESPEALRAYLEGEVHFRHFDLVAAERAYKRAVHEDSTFALAHYRLADTYLWPAGATGDPTPHIERAVRLSDRLPAREAVLVKALHASVLGNLDGVEPLRQWVQTHPDDAEAWYQLADTYLHSPGVWATAEEIAQLFERAVELDPRNAKYLLHHVQFAWWLDADSARAARRAVMYREAAPRHPLARAGPLALALAFGDSMARSRVMSGLGREDFEVIMDVRRLLAHPRYSVLPAVLRELKEHANDGQTRPWVIPQSNRDLFWYYALWHGRMREGLSVLDDPSMSMSVGARAGLLYEAAAAGLPVPEERFEETLASVAIDSAEGGSVYWAGLFAADRNRWADYRRAVTAYERAADRAAKAGDSVAARNWLLTGKALRGYGLWRQGRPADALPIVTDPQLLPLRSLRWWLSRIQQELGHLRDAERVYGSFLFLEALSVEPLAQYELGRIHEALGEHDEARESYEYFIEHWKDADPELQPMVEEARQAVIRITGVRQE